LIEDHVRPAFRSVFGTDDGRLGRGSRRQRHADGADDDSCEEHGERTHALLAT
jgi:hypothetical protein